MLNWEINNVISKQRFQNHFTDFGIIVLFPNVWFVYHFLIYICELFTVKIPIWKTLNRNLKKFCCWSGFLSFWEMPLLSFEVQQNFPCSLRKRCLLECSFLLHSNLALTRSTLSPSSPASRTASLPQLITIRLRFLQHLLLKNIPLLLLSCLLSEA